MNFSRIIQNEIAFERQLVNILNSNFQPYSSGKNYYNFRCNICGDSKKNKFKRRAFLLKKNDGWVYFCHNQCGGKSAIKWMREYFPLNYKDYIREVLSNKKENIVKKTVVQVINKEQISEKEDLNFFVPILKGKGKLFEEAIEVCKSRLLPESIWSKWFVAIDGKYKNRLVIPFFDNKNKIYYWQGRSLKEWMLPKYMSRLGENFNNIYNYYNVDKSKEVIILEGAIDSLFIENAIALTGLKIRDEKLKVFKQKYFLLDGDDAGKKKALKLLDKNEYVFNWNKFIRDQSLPNREKWDINETIIYLQRTIPFTVEELKPYFTKSIYDKVNFII